MTEVVGMFLRVCLTAGCYYFPQPFATLASCTEQGTIEVAGKTGKFSCLKVTYLAAPPACSGQGSALCTGR